MVMAITKWRTFGKISVVTPILSSLTAQAVHTAIIIPSRESHTPFHSNMYHSLRGESCIGVAFITANNLASSSSSYPVHFKAVRRCTSSTGEKKRITIRWKKANGDIISTSAVIGSTLLNVARAHDIDMEVRLL